jgi:predicted helicase
MTYSDCVYFGKSPDLKHNFTKCGKTSNLINRKGVIQTGYPLNEFEVYMLIKCSNKEESQQLEDLIHSEFLDYNTINNDNYNGTSNEWFNYEFTCEEIKQLLVSYDYNNVILIDSKLNEYVCGLKRQNYNKYGDINIKQQYISKMKSLKAERLNIPTPNDMQSDIVKCGIEFYKANNRGKFNGACGIGKTLISLFISKGLGCKTILIGVPYTNLLYQWNEEIKKLYLKTDILIVGGGGTTDIDEINIFIKLNKPKIVITTYASSHIVKRIIDELNFKFNFKIGDEAHHLTSNEKNESKQWITFHKIESEKTLFMTATERFIESKNNKILYSMEDEIIFGKHIHPPISIKSAIDNKKITDYNVVLLKNTEEQVDNIIKNIGLPSCNRNLFISAYVSLESIQKYNDLTHILIYCNRTDNAELIINYIRLIIEKELIVFDSETFYYNDYHSKRNYENKVNSLKLFKQSKYGVLSCVYELGEGTNIPELNGVVFAENMESDIRITQCALRANRLNGKYPNKIAYYIIPWIDTDDWDKDGVPFEKVKKIISKLENEDDTISQKIVLCETKNKKNNKKNKQIYVDYEELYLEDNNNELNQIKLRLKYKGSLKSNCSQEEDEFNLMKHINQQLNIKDKYEYPIRKNENNMYKENPDKYFKKHGVWNGWYDFLGIDTTKFIKTKNEWILFCKKKNVKDVDMYKNLCAEYPQLPHEPKEFYPGFTNICNELGVFNQRR